MEYGRWILVAVRCTQIWSAQKGWPRLAATACCVWLWGGGGRTSLIAGEPAPTGSAVMRKTR